MSFFPACDGTRLAHHTEGAASWDETGPLVCLPGGPGRASAYLGDLNGLSAHHTLIRLPSVSDFLSS